MGKRKPQFTKHMTTLSPMEN